MPTDSTGWVWWAVSVIGVGVAINLFTAFLYPRIEKAWARRSTTKKAKLEAKAQEFQRQVQQLVNRPERLDSLKLDLILLYLQFLSLIAVSGMALLFLKQVPLFVSAGILASVLALLSCVLLVIAAIGGLAFCNVVLDRITKTRRLLRQAEKALAVAEETKDTTSG